MVTFGGLVKRKKCVVEFFVLIFSTVDSSVRLSSVLLVFESSHWHQALTCEEGSIQGNHC